MGLLLLVIAWMCIVTELISTLLEPQSQQQQLILLMQLMVTHYHNLLLSFWLPCSAGESFFVK
jgi:hypothetical protein